LVTHVSIPAVMQDPVYVSKTVMQFTSDVVGTRRSPLESGELLTSPEGVATSSYHVKTFSEAWFASQGNAPQGAIGGNVTNNDPGVVDPDAGVALHQITVKHPDGSTYSFKPKSDLLLLPLPVTPGLQW